MQWNVVRAKTYIEDELSLGPSGLGRFFQFIFRKLKKVRKTPGFSKAGNSGWLVITDCMWCAGILWFKKILKLCWNQVPLMVAVALWVHGHGITVYTSGPPGSLGSFSDLSMASGFLRSSPPLSFGSFSRHLQKFFFCILWFIKVSSCPHSEWHFFVTVIVTHFYFLLLSLP